MKSIQFLLYTTFLCLTLGTLSGCNFKSDESSGTPNCPAESLAKPNADGTIDCFPIEPDAPTDETGDPTKANCNSVLKLNDSQNVRINKTGHTLNCTYTHSGSSTYVLMKYSTDLARKAKVKIEQDGRDLTAAIHHTSIDGKGTYLALFKANGKYDIAVTLEKQGNIINPAETIEITNNFASALSFKGGEKLAFLQNANDANDDSRMLMVDIFNGLSDLLNEQQSKEEGSTEIKLDSGNWIAINTADKPSYKISPPNTAPTFTSDGTIIYNMKAVLGSFDNLFTPPVTEDLSSWIHSANNKNIFSNDKNEFKFTDATGDGNTHYAIIAKATNPEGDHIDIKSKGSKITTAPITNKETLTDYFNNSSNYNESTGSAIVAIRNIGRDAKSGVDFTITNNSSTAVIYNLSIIKIEDTAGAKNAINLEAGESLRFYNNISDSCGLADTYLITHDGDSAATPEIKAYFRLNFSDDKKANDETFRIGSSVYKIDSSWNIKNLDESCSWNAGTPLLTNP